MLYSAPFGFSSACRWVLLLVQSTAGYFYNTFAYEICFNGIHFYGIYIYGIYIYRALKFLSIECTVVRNT
jgi:hypothetical protein